MLFFYNLGIRIYHIILQFLALCGHKKAKLFIHGRNEWKSIVSKDIKNETRNKIWFHVSSLGEFEQTMPLLDYLFEHSDYAIILTFFSPSGYELKKDYSKADYIYYLPIDTKKNAQNWIQILKPNLAIFTKYDYWYHYLNELHLSKIPVIIHSSIYQKRQPFFKWYGSLHRKMLTFFDHIFVQDSQSLALLNSIEIHNVSVIGDMRIDRVLEIKDTKWKDERIEHFKKNHQLLIVGSAWKEDWNLILACMDQFSSDLKILIAPHEISNSNILELKQKFKDYDCDIYTQYSKLSSTKVLILDTIGMLSKVYRYGDFAYIGGGFNYSGIHNTLEPAVYGLPIWIGPNYQKFIEAKTLVESGGMKSVINAKEFISSFQNQASPESMSKINESYIQKNKGALKSIINYLKLEKYLSTTP